ncbi:hypothetical protein HK101_003295, partial [Irineochytrium annulatum]
NGPVIANVQINPIYYGNANYQAEMNAYYKGVAGSSYITWLSEYNTPTQTIGAGTFGSSYVEPSPAAKGTLDDAKNIQPYLRSLVSKGVIKPSANAYFPIHFAPGYTITMQGSASCSVFCAYHGTIDVSDISSTKYLYYGVMPDQGGSCAGGCGTSSAMVNNLRSVSSHELVEAITDPAVGLDVLSWYNDQSGEIGDLCNGKQTTIKGTDGASYTSQQQWDDKANVAIMKLPAILADVAAAVAALNTTTATLLLLSTIATVTAVAHASARRKYKQLPGPRGIPILGNLLQVDTSRQHVQFLDFHKKYGPMFRLNIGDVKIVVISDPEVACELLVRRSEIYSSRRSAQVANAIMSKGQRMVLMEYDEEWKHARKALHTILSSSFAKTMRSTQDLESMVLINDLLNHHESYAKAPRTAGNTGHWFAYVRRFTTSIVLNMSYGRRVGRVFDNPDVDRVYEAMEAFVLAARPGAYLADALDFVAALPDWAAPWRADLRRMHEKEMELWGGLLERCKKELEEGTARECFVRNILIARRDAVGGDDEKFGNWVDKGLKEGKMTDLFLAYNAATVLEAGSDTTASTICNFILAMIEYPHVLKKAHEEIDRVVGPDRLPEFSDEPNLPYIRAIVKEILRRRPPTILGVPHVASRDDVYDDVLIEKGTLVIGNIWAMHMDPKLYPNPMEFNPDRFLSHSRSAADLMAQSNPAERDHYAYGFGRRACQGVHLAESSLFIVLARICWAFDVLPGVDEATGKAAEGLTLNEEERFSEGFVSHPKEFPARFLVRDEGKKKIIKEAFAVAQEKWAEMGLEGDEREIE